MRHSSAAGVSIGMGGGGIVCALHYSRKQRKSIVYVPVLSTADEGCSFLEHSTLALMGGKATTLSAISCS